MMWEQGADGADLTFLLGVCVCGFVNGFIYPWQLDGLIGRFFPIWWLICN